MDLADIANLRLINQQIAASSITNVKGLVNWIGAIQAQDFPMSKWAVGVRLPYSTEQIIENAFDEGQIIRTHLLRPTWHIVSSDDIYWMLDLTAHRIKASLKTRHNELGLKGKILTKSNSIIEKALNECGQLSREELVTRLKEAKIQTDENRASHLLFHAELDGIACSGPLKKGRHTYALLGKRVPRTKYYSKEEALVKLAMKYFNSRSPASMQDFIWWSGLSVRDAKAAIENIKSDFITETMSSQTYFINRSIQLPKYEKESVYVLPAFDEFIISYKDRSASLPFKNHKKAVSNNGMFRAIVVVNGQVVGIWNRTFKKEKVNIQVEYFRKLAISTQNKVEEKFGQFGIFLNKEVEIIHKIYQAS